MDMTDKNKDDYIKINKFKTGEKEAVAIMKSKGFEFDVDYYDDNSRSKMPDFKLSTGRFIEVTHTNHNNKDWNTPNSFGQKPLDERVKIAEGALQAYERLCKDNYEHDEKGVNERNRDRKVVKAYYGYDFDTHKRTEFGCALKGMSFSINNVLNEINIDKGKKYPNGDVDLFIFVIEEEYNCVLSHKKNFLEKAKFSPFKTIYLCVWDMFNNKYETENPKMLKIDLGVNPPSICDF